MMMDDVPVNAFAHQAIAVAAAQAVTLSEVEQAADRLDFNEFESEIISVVVIDMDKWKTVYSDERD